MLKINLANTVKFCNRDKNAVLYVLINKQLTKLY